LNAIGKSTAEMTAIKICETKPPEPPQILTSSQPNQHLVEGKNQCLYQDCPRENLRVPCVKQKHYFVAARVLAIAGFHADIAKIFKREARERSH
jgi:hypothetical protein